jgi:DNA-binding CsgD family transcriptional regulator
VFRRIALPVELNDLLFLCSGQLGIGGPPDDLQTLENRLADPGVDASRSAEIRIWMERLWKEIGELAERQRQALLLNLREPGGAAIGLFQDFGVAGFGQVAAALSLTEGELSELWRRLPLSDNEIAERLGIGRQQVINLRSAARQRLARRMRGYQ